MKAVVHRDRSSSMLRLLAGRVEKPLILTRGAVGLRFAVSLQVTCVVMFLGLSSIPALSQVGGSSIGVDVLRGALEVGGSFGVAPRPAAAFDDSADPRKLRNRAPPPRFECRFDKSAIPGGSLWRENIADHLARGVPQAPLTNLSGSSANPATAGSRLSGTSAESAVSSVLGGNPADNTNAGKAPNSYVPSDFELYVEAQTGHQLCRFGAQVFYDLSSFFEPAPLGAVPEDYVLGAGDEVFVRVWGSLERDSAFVIDRSGLIVLPKVGPIKLAGVRYGQAADVIRQAMRKMYADFSISVTMGRIRGIRVLVTGFAERPGAYNVSSLSSLSSLIMSSGGPSSAGSYRRIELRRGGKTIANFDAYDLLVDGSRAGDKLLLNEDVIHFGPVADQVAVFGGVNRPGIYEIKPGETIDSIIKVAGGQTPGSDSTAVFRLAVTERAQGFRSIDSARIRSYSANGGDIFLIRNDLRLASAVDRASKRVTIAGQVRSPGEYFLPPNATLKDAIQAAGGTVHGAYLYGTELRRLSVRLQQENTLERVVRELDRNIVASSTLRPLNADEARLLQVRTELSKTLVERLQNVRPDGRLSLPISPQSSDVPVVELEHGDQITIPLIPAFVGVYGSVVSGGTYLFRSGGRISDYLSAAGGAKKGSEASESFIIRANGQAEKLFPDETPGFFGFRSLRRSNVAIYPGDNIIVPEDMAKTTVYRETLAYTTLLYQLGLGVAAFKVLTK
jgi:protein involved in polysaccharide export with SLBB domain